MKRGSPTTITAAADRTRKCIDAFSDYFGEDVFLVPVPRHAPIYENGGLGAERRRQYGHHQREVRMVWPAQMIAAAFVRRQLGKSWQPILKRRKVVEKSATLQEPRTVSRHLQTITAVPTIDYPRRIVVVDDVVTSGATLFAATGIVAEACPNAVVKSFALIRALSGQEIPETPNQCLHPCTGTIIRNANDTTTREP